MHLHVLARSSLLTLIIQGCLELTKSKKPVYLVDSSSVVFPLFLLVNKVSALITSQHYKACVDHHKLCCSQAVGADNHCACHAACIGARSSSCCQNTQVHAQGQQLSKRIDWHHTQTAHRACFLLNEQFSQCIAHV